MIKMYYISHIIVTLIKFENRTFYINYHTLQNTTFLQTTFEVTSVSSPSSSLFSTHLDF